MTAQRVMKGATDIVLGRAAPLLEREIKKRTPHGLPGTSNLHRSITTEKGRGYVRAYSTSKYAAPVERGRKAGARPPPARALAPWVRRAGLPPGTEYPIARAIGRRGIKGKFMFRDGGREASKQLKNRKIRKVSDHMRNWRRRR